MNTNTIHKYKLEIADVQIVTLPVHAEILVVRVQKKDICMWVKVNTKESEFDEHTIYMFGTGHPMGNEEMEYISTIQLHDGGLIFHFFKGIL